MVFISLLISCGWLIIILILPRKQQTQGENDGGWVRGMVTKSLLTPLAEQSSVPRRSRRLCWGNPALGPSLLSWKLRQ